MSVLKLIKFDTSWCLFCKHLDEVIEAHPPEVDVYEKVNLDNNPQMVQAFNLKSVPTLVLLKDGVEVNRLTGKVGPARLKEFVRSVS